MAKLIELSKADQVKWESTKRAMTVDRKEKIFKESASLGVCNVSMSFIDDELFLEIMPKETSDMNGDVEGVIVNVKEEDCHVTSLMKMISNARNVKDAVLSCKPIKVFK